MGILLIVVDDTQDARGEMFRHTVAENLERS